MVDKSGPAIEGNMLQMFSGQMPLIAALPRKILKKACKKFWKKNASNCC